MPVVNPAVRFSDYQDRYENIRFSRHDGILSARRSYTASVLETAARTGAPGYDIRIEEGSRWHPRALDVLRPVVGIRS